MSKISAGRYRLYLQGLETFYNERRVRRFIEKKTCQKAVTISEREISADRFRKDDADMIKTRDIGVKEIAVT